VTLEVRDLGREGSFEKVNLTLRAGEILGLAGLVGSGRSEVARAIAGVDNFDTGEILLHGETLRVRDPAGAIRAGVALIPDSRRDLGLVMNNSVGFNVSLPHLRPLSAAGFMRRRRERGIVESARNRAGVNAGPSRTMDTLSGGNQQKTLFARWMAAPPQVLLADEPTRGIDVGSKRGIYDLVTDLAREGLSVLLISNENEELLGLAHRILVMRNGRVVAEMDGARASEKDLVRAAFGASA
jgi:ABC-type sugar transport system ATPase subunit